MREIIEEDYLSSNGIKKTPAYGSKNFLPAVSMLTVETGSIQQVNNKRFGTRAQSTEKCCKLMEDITPRIESKSPVTEEFNYKGKTAELLKAKGLTKREIRKKEIELKEV